MAYEPTLTWHVSLPLSELPIGPALTPEQRDIEERIGVTHEILWAYADAMSQLLGEAIMEDVQPLGFGRGALVAIATETPVRLPHVRFVQTTSVDVCREMGSYVPAFHIKGRACLDALIQYGSAVKTVWVRDCPAFDVQASFEVIFLDFAAENPYWRIRFGHDHLLRLAVIDDAAWLCWDRDKRHPIIDVDHKDVAGRFGPRDVAPEKHPPPWAPAEAHLLGGTGWAATMINRETSQSQDQVFATPERRFLLVQSFPAYPGHAAIVRAWREKRPLRPILEGTNTHSVAADLELHEREAVFHWVGTHRVLRIRQGKIEQLTTDHTLYWHVLQTQPELVGTDAEAQFAQYKNVVVTSLGTHDFTEGKCDLEPGDRFVLLRSDAHECLLEAAPNDLAARLSVPDVREAAAWAARALRTADGTMRHPALFVDTEATVTMAQWYDEPVHMQCSAGEATTWRLFSSIPTKPWINPISWRQGVREQMAAGKLLSTPPNEGDVLNFNHHGVSFVWRDGQWHDVWITEEKFTLRDRGTVTFPDRGAIAVVKRLAAQERPDALEKAGFLAEATWLRAQDAPWPSLRRMLDHRLGQTTKDAIMDRAEVISPPVRDLVEHPKQYHGRRIRTRGIFRSMFESMTFADAWFECATRFPLGAWLVEVDGTWSSDGSAYGHFGFYKSHLAGDAQLISIQEPRPIPPDRIRFSRPYVPLVSEITLERRLQGYTYNKEWVHRLGGDARFPEPESPDSRRARVVFTYTAFHLVCLFSWTWLDDPKPLVAEAATAANPGNRGRFVELKGMLAPNGSDWPLLDGLLRVVPPPMSRTSDRYAMPQPKEQEALRQWLGDGKVVRILGEVGLEMKIIYAISIDGHTRPMNAGA